MRSSSMYEEPSCTSEDPRIASLTSQVPKAIPGADELDKSDDDIFDELEKAIDDDPDLGALREQRMEELKREMERIGDMRKQDHGRLTEITDEKEVIRTSANEKCCVIHFYHRDFKRCETMNRHLEVLAPKYFGTRFLRVFVENVPWLVEKLAIKVLPCVICFVNGVSKDRLIGFEDLGNADAFETAALELRLQTSGVIEKPTANPADTRRMYYSTSTSRIRGPAKDNINSDSDLDD